MSIYSDDLSALLVERTKPLRLVPRADSLASESSSLYRSSDYLQPSTPRQSSLTAPPSSTVVDQEPYSPTISDSSEAQRMSVLGPKIHKNGQAPWELDEDTTAIGEASDDATTLEGASIFGRRHKGKAKKSSKPTTSSSSSKGRQRSRTIAESISPVGALKGLGLGMLGGSASPSAPQSRTPSRTSRNPTPEPPRSTAQAESFISCSDDDAFSISTATVTETGGSVRHLDVRYASQLPDVHKAQGGRTRSQTVSNVAPLNIKRKSSRTSVSSANHSSQLMRRPSPARSVRESRIGPEDMFRSSVASQADSPYYSNRTNSHPYSNPALLKVHPGEISAFSSDSSPSPSPMGPSPAWTAARSSMEDFLDSPSSSSQKDGQSTLSVATHEDTPPSPVRKVNRKKAPPPPLLLRPSPSSTSLSSAKRYLPKSLTPKSRVNSGSEMFEIDPRSREDLPTPVPPFYNQGSGNPSATSLRRTPNLAPNPLPEGTLPPQPSTPAANTDDLPPGMLTFPGSPAYALISLEQAQARMRTSSANDGKKRKEKEGLSGLVARMRMNSDLSEGSTLSPAMISSPLETLPNKPPLSPFPTASGDLPSPPAVKPVPQLRQRKSGFLKLFTSGEKLRSGTTSPNPMPTPTSGESVARDYALFSPMTPVISSAQQASPSPITTLPPLPKVTVMGRRSSKTGSIPAQTPSDAAEHPVPPVPSQYRPLPASPASSVNHAREPPFWKSKVGDDGRLAVSLNHSLPRKPTPLQRETEVSPSSESASSPDDAKQTQVLVVTGISSPGGVQFPTSAPAVGGHSAEKDQEPMLRLRHVSTNFLTSLPSDYLVERRGDPDDHTPALSPATPSFNSMASMSSVYASSESSMSPLPTPNSMHHLSPSPYVRTASGISPISERGDEPASLQEQLASLKKQIRNQAYEAERQIRELRGEIERLRSAPTPPMACAQCGSHDVHRQSDDLHTAHLSISSGEGQEGASTPMARSIVNRSRAPTGNGTRFGSRLD